MPCSLGTGREESAEAKDIRQSWMQRPNRMRFEGALSFVSDFRIAVMSVPDAMADTDPDSMGVTRMAFNCAGESMVMEGLIRY